MDDAQWERLQAKRERNARFYALDYAARHPKKIAKPTTPRAKRAPDESGADRQVLREHHWALTRSRKAVRKALTKGLRAILRAERRAGVQAERDAAWEGRKAARQHRTPRPYTPKPRHEWGTRTTGRPSRRPANCEGCGRATRPRASRSEDYPGCIRYAGYGLCDSCSRGQDPARRNDLIHDGSTSCSDCGWTLRKRTATLAEEPGTRQAWVRDGSGGYLCKACHTRSRRNALVA